jgi:hypothetical protein
MSWPQNRRKLNEHISSPSRVSSKDEDTLDPYNVQQNFRKTANKLSRRLLFIFVFLLLYSKVTNG